MQRLKEYVPFIVLLVIILLLKCFVVTTIKVNGDSMYPTLKNKDIMLLDKVHYRFSDIKRFDIVVVEKEDTKIIKRIIGLPGEKITYRDNKLYVNDEEVKDIYNSIVQEDFTCFLESDEYFVMGDNRKVSLDSRSIGPVKKEQVMGRANFVIFPFSRWGSVK